MLTNIKSYQMHDTNHIKHFYLVNTLFSFKSSNIILQVISIWLSDQENKKTLFSHPSPTVHEEFSSFRIWQIVKWLITIIAKVSITHNQFLTYLLLVIYDSSYN